MARGRNNVELTPAQIAEAERLHKEFPLKEVAKQMHFSVEVLRRALVRRGSAMRSMSSSPWRKRAKRGNASTERRRHELKRALDTGMSVAQAAAKFGVSVAAIQRDMRALEEG